MAPIGDNPQSTISISKRSVNDLFKKCYHDASSAACIRCLSVRRLGVHAHHHAVEGDKNRHGFRAQFLPFPETRQKLAGTLLHASPCLPGCWVAEYFDGEWAICFGLDRPLFGEAPFGPWVATVPTFDLASAQRSVALHEAGLAELADLAYPAIFSTRVRLGAGGRLVNEAFVLQDGIYRALHHKQVFPDKQGFYEARWFEPGPLRFGLMELAGLKIGVIVCSELMFPELASHYGNLGANVLMVPRATYRDNVESWITAARMAAYVSGCYVLSSNRAGYDFRGVGFAVDPGGEELLRTGPNRPVEVVEIDPCRVTEVRRHYPHTIKSQLGSTLRVGLRLT